MGVCREGHGLGDLAVEDGFESWVVALMVFAEGFVTTCKAKEVLELLRLASTSSESYVSNRSNCSIGLQWFSPFVSALGVDRLLTLDQRYALYRSFSTTKTYLHIIQLSFPLLIMSSASTSSPNRPKPHHDPSQNNEVKSTPRRKVSPPAATSNPAPARS